MTGTYAGSFSGSAPDVAVVGISAVDGHALNSPAARSSGRRSLTGLSQTVARQSDFGTALAGTLTNAGSIVVDTGVIVYQGSTSSAPRSSIRPARPSTFRAPPTSTTPTLTEMSTTAAPLLTPARWRSPQEAAQRPSPTRSPTRAPSWSTPPRSIQRARSPEPTPRSPSPRRQFPDVGHLRRLVLGLGRRCRPVG